MNRFHKLKRRIIWLSILQCWSLLLWGQQPSKGPDVLKAWKIQPIVGLQLWSSYTIGQRQYNEETNRYEPVADRLNFQLRRSRLGLKGQIATNLFFNVTSSLDLVGRDVLAGTEAGSNSGSSPRFRLWHAYVRWKASDKHEKLNVVTGYFLPQIGRASITSAMRTTGMEKAWSQNYLRRHLTGTGTGRTMGIQLGGLFLRESTGFHWGYDLGLFNPSFERHDSNSAGLKYAPVVTARIATYFGEPESRNYTLSRKINYLGKRQGLTLALAGASQGATDYFDRNGAAGFDFLLNLKHLNLDGEWNYLWRSAGPGTEGIQRNCSSLSQTGFLRISYNFFLPRQYVLEPVAMLVRFNGAMDMFGQQEATLLGSPSGLEQVIDIGGNFYFSPNLKLSLHYTKRRGDDGTAGMGSTVNNFFYQQGWGAIQRGNWVGLGLVAIL